MTSILPTKQFKKIVIGSIMANPNQPRRIFDEQAILELADSIKQYGVITPLTVRKTDEGYELIAGERRLRASAAAGLDSVPCYIIDADDEESTLMALVENLQRRDLDFFEEALGLQRLTDIYGMTQQQAAEKIGKTQSSVANKLRILRLSSDIVEIIRKNGLTERHARAMLQLSDKKQQLKAIKEIVKYKMNVERTEAYIERIVSGSKKESGKSTRIIKDVRLFLNTINRAVALMQGSGVGASVERDIRDDIMVVTISIPSKR